MTVSPAPFRGKLVSINQLAIVIGIVLGPTGELASSCGATTSALATFVAWTVRRSAPAASTRPKIIGGDRLDRATTHVTTTSGSNVRFTPGLKNPLASDAARGK